MVDRIEEWDNKQGLDEDDPGEVPTSFATKGVGWSGREKQDDDKDDEKPKKKKGWDHGRP